MGSDDRITRIHGPLGPFDRALVRWVINPLVHLSMYVQGPIAVYRTHTTPRRIETRPVAAGERPALPAALAEWLARTEGLVGECGFGEPVRGVTDVPGVRSHLSLFGEPDSGDVAECIASQAYDGQGRVVYTVIYRAPWADGTATLTVSGGTGSVLPPPRYVDGARFTTVADPRELHRLHRFRCEPCRRAGAVPDLSWQRDLLAASNAESARIQEGWVRAGWYRENGDLLRPTVKGAVRMVWSQLVPIRTVRRWLGEARARRILRAARRASVV